MTKVNFNLRNAVKTVALLAAMALSSSGAMAQYSWSGTQTLANGDNITQNITLTGDVTISVPSGATATISGVITGAYNLTKSGSGTLILTANNNIGGNVTIGGTLQLGNGGTAGSLGSSVTKIVITKATGATAGYLRINRSNVLTISCPISNALTGNGGTLTKEGAGTLYLTGNNTYTANTIVTAGMLLIGSGGTTGSIAGDIKVAKDATVYFYRSNAYTYSGVISENSMIPAQQGGKVTLSGSGELTLSGASTYTGKTTVLGGNLNIASGGSILNTGEIAVASGKKVVFNNASAETYAMPVTGAGSIEKNGSGKLTFSGALSYTGATTITAGTLNVGQGGTFASSNVVINGNYLDFEVLADITLTYGGVISGTGAMSKWGAGTLILTGTNTYTGLTTVYGTLQLGDGGSTGTIANTSNVVLSNAASELVFNRNASYSFGKVISGSGKVTQKKYQVNFTADNTYTGVTTIAAGTKISIGASDLATATGSIASASIVNDGTLQFYRGNAYTLAAVISGSGDISHYGAGATTLSGANTYTGATYIQNGTLKLSATGTIANSSGVTFNNDNNAKFDISAGNKTIKNLNSTDANDTIVLGTRTLTLGTATDADCGGGTYAGVITGTAAAASAAIAKYGQGTLVLSGTSAYSGRTYIYHGTVQFSAPNNFGTSNLYFSSYTPTLKWAAGNASDISARILQLATNVTFDLQSNNVTFATALPTGVSTLYKTGSGWLYLTADNTRNSIFEVQQGSLFLGNNTTTGSWTGNIVLPTAGLSYLEIKRSNAYTYSGVISGAGAVENIGSGAFTLAGNNTFTGTLFATNGDITVGNGATSGSIATQNVVVSLNKIFKFNRSDNVAYSGVISGNGAVTQSGTGTLTLNGANTYKGATGIVSSGTLELGASGTIENSAAVALMLANAKFKISSDKKIQYLVSSQANNEIMLNGGNLTINDTTTNASTQTVAGVISGTGGIIKTGTNTLTFGGANTYSGETRIQGGTLVLNATGTVANSSAVYVTNQGKFNVSAGNKTVKNLHGAATGNEVILGSSTLQIGTSTGSADGSGTFAGKFTGAGSVMKTGAQTFAFNGTSTATGSFSLAGGTLQTANAATWAGNFSQAAGTILDIAGTFNVSGSLSLNGGSVEMSLQASNPSKIVASGIASLANTTGLNFSASAGNYTLIQASNGLNNSHSNGRFSFPTIAGLTLTPNSTATNLTLVVAVSDLTAPTIGSALAAGTATSTSVPLTWGAATDDQTVASNLHYTVYRSTSNNIGTVANCEANGTVVTSGTAITSASATGLAPNTPYYFNVVVKDNANNKAAYTAVSKTTAKATLDGTVAISGNAVFGQILTAETTGLTSTPSVALGALTYQWKRGGTNIGTNAATYTLVQADINSTITVVVTAANTDGSVTSAATATVGKADQVAPAVPTLASKTHNSITLNAVAGCEYRIMDEITYVQEQTGTAFTGLTPERTYHLYQRYAETATHNASPYNAYPGLTVVTDVEPAITSIDITPATATVQKGQTQQFSANVVTVGSATSAVTWSIVGTHHASTTVSASGLLSVAAAETANSLQVKITSDFSSDYTAIANVTLTDAPAVTAVSVSANADEVMKGQTLQFSAQVTAVGGASEIVTWSIVGAHHASTTVSSGGLLTVNAAETAVSLTVRATSQFNATVYGEYTVSVLDIPAVNSVTVLPATISVQKGQNQQFTANVTAVGGASESVTWSIAGAHHASTTISASGLLSIAAAETEASLTVRATSDFNPAVYGNATVTVTDIPVTPEVISVEVSPATVELQKGQNTQFFATVTVAGGASTDVVWSVLGASAATIDAAGHLTVPAGETANSITVKAVSTFNSAKFGTATVTLTDAPAVTAVAVLPATASVQKGQNQQFTANVTAVGGASESVTWSIVGAHHASTTISAGGLLSVAAAETEASLTVRATSDFNSAVYGDATITVTDLPVTPEVISVEVSPSEKLMNKGETFTFTATVIAVGGASEAITWSISGNNSASTAISSGTVQIAADETAANITVTATSVFDSSKKGTALISVQTVGLADAFINSISVYPNPFVDFIKIDDAQNADVRLMDLNGRIIKIINNISDSEVINVGTIPTGTYLLHISKNGEKGVVKVVKQ